MLDREIVEGIGATLFDSLRAKKQSRR